MHHQLAPTWSSACFFLLATACWGLGAVLSKGILSFLAPITLLVLQLVASVFALGSVAMLVRPPFPARSQVLLLSLTGLLNPGLAYLLSLLALSRTTASSASLIWAIQPMVIVLLAWIVLRERVSLVFIGYSCVAIAGVILVTVSGGITSNPSGFLGNVLAIGAALCASLYVVLTRRLMLTIQPLAAIVIQQVAALLFVFLVWGVANQVTSPVRVQAEIPFSVYIGALLSGLVYYAGAFGFYSIGLRQTSASQAGAFLNLTPLFGIAGGAFFLGERLTPLGVVGASLIVIAIIAILLGSRPVARSV